jgi:hypothetical protein
MRYLLMIYHNEAEHAKWSQEQLGAEYQAFNEFTEAIAKSGALESGNALMQTNSATTVRVRNGKTLTTDGPFAETKEQISGYYLVNCKDLDEAISWAARIPTASDGSIEIRPIREFE